MRASYSTWPRLNPTTTDSVQRLAQAEARVSRGPSGDAAFVHQLRITLAKGHHSKANPFGQLGRPALLEQKR